MRVESGRVGSGQEVLGDLMGRVGSVQEVFKYRGSGRVTLTPSDPRRSYLTREKPCAIYKLWTAERKYSPHPIFVFSCARVETAEMGWLN